MPLSRVALCAVYDPLQSFLFSCLSWLTGIGKHMEKLDSMFVHVLKYVPALQLGFSKVFGMIQSATYLCCIESDVHYFKERLFIPLIKHANKYNVRVSYSCQTSFVQMQSEGEMRVKGM